MKRTIVCAAFAAMIAFPMSALASAPFMGPTDGDDEIPIIDLIRYMFTTSDNSAYFIIMRSYGSSTFNQ